MSSNKIKLFINSVEDRQTVAGILCVNGYSVSTIKQPIKQGARSNYYGLGIVDTLDRDTSPTENEKKDSTQS